MTWLCWLGFHLWDYCSLTMGVGFTVTAVHRTCLRCEREQVFARGVQQWITVKE